MDEPLCLRRSGGDQSALERGRALHLGEWADAYCDKAFAQITVGLDLVGRAARDGTGARRVA